MLGSTEFSPSVVLDRMGKNATSQAQISKASSVLRT